MVSLGLKALDSTDSESLISISIEALNLNNVSEFYCIQSLREEAKTLEIQRYR